MNPVRKIAEYAVVCILFSYVASFTVIPIALNGNSMTVKTGSMSPALNPGDMIISVKATPNDLKAGDIFTYMPDDPSITGGITMTHRVESLVYTNGELIQIIAKGDANPVTDPPIRPDQIRTKMIYSVPFAGYPRLLMG